MKLRRLLEELLFPGVMLMIFYCIINGFVFMIATFEANSRDSDCRTKQIPRIYYVALPGLLGCPIGYWLGEHVDRPSWTTIPEEKK